MPISRREEAMAEMFTQLSAMSGWGAILRNYTGEISNLPTAVMHEGGEEVEDEATHNYQITIPVTVEVYVGTANHASIGTEISARIADIKEALLVEDGEAQTLNGFAEAVRYSGMDGPFSEYENGGSPYEKFFLQFDVLIEHAELDPSAKR